MVFFRRLSEVTNYTTLIDGLFLNRARTHPKRAISGMPGRNCARVFQKQQHRLRERLADVENSLKSTAKSVFNIQ
jgi:beta-carotene ketolase (CrtO type)